MQGMLSQYCAIVPLLVDATDIATSGVDCDSIDMSKWDHCMMCFTFDSTASGDSVFKVYGGTDDGSKTQAITFTYRIGSAACKSTSADVLSAPATSAALSVGAGEPSRLLVIEFNTADLVYSGTQYRYATANYDSGASTLTGSGFAVLSRGRFARDIQATVIG